MLVFLVGKRVKRTHVPKLLKKLQKYKDCFNEGKII